MTMKMKRGVFSSRCCNGGLCGIRQSITKEPTNTTSQTTMSEWRRLANILGLSFGWCLMVSIMFIQLSTSTLAARSYSGPSTATLPAGIMMAAATLTATPGTLLMQRYGRRPVFLLSSLAAAGGGALMCAAAKLRQLWLLVLGSVPLGVAFAQANNLRFAATDFATRGTEPRALSIVVTGAMLSAVVGPQVGAYTRNALEPQYLGTYVFVTGLCLLFAALVLVIEFHRTPELVAEKEAAAAAAAQAMAAEAAAAEKVLAAEKDLGRSLADGQGQPLAPVAVVVDVTDRSSSSVRENLASRGSAASSSSSSSSSPSSRSTPGGGQVGEAAAAEQGCEGSQQGDVEQGSGRPTVLSQPEFSQDGAVLGMVAERSLATAGSRTCGALAQGGVGGDGGGDSTARDGALAGSVVVVQVDEAAAASAAAAAGIPERVRECKPPSSYPMLQLFSSADYLVPVLTASLAYGGMAGVMTATPLALGDAGYAFSDTTQVIQVHILGMFVPSLFTGDVVRLLGAANTMAAGALLLLGGTAVFFAGASSLPVFFGGNAVVGLGWNWAYVGASAMVAARLAALPTVRFKAQGAMDTVVLGCTGLTVVLAGTVYSWLGWGAYVPVFMVVNGLSVVLDGSLLAVWYWRAWRGRRGKGQQR